MGQILLENHEKKRTIMENEDENENKNNGKCRINLDINVADIILIIAVATVFIFFIGSCNNASNYRMSYYNYLETCKELKLTPKPPAQEI